jgi:hypothetical protein
VLDVVEKVGCGGVGLLLILCTFSELGSTVNVGRSTAMQESLATTINAQITALQSKSCYGV